MNETNLLNFKGGSMKLFLLVLLVLMVVAAGLYADHNPQLKPEKAPEEKPTPKKPKLTTEKTEQVPSPSEIHAAEVGEYMMPGTVVKSQEEGQIQEPPKSIGRTAQENFLSVCVLLFGLLFSGLLTMVVLKTSPAKPLGTTNIKLFGLTIVITAGLFLICAGYSQNQIAPMIGLLGSIAGYILGKDAPKESAEK